MQPAPGIVLFLKSASKSQLVLVLLLMVDKLARDSLAITERNK